MQADRLSRLVADFSRLGRQRESARELARTARDLLEAVRFVVRGDRVRRAASAGATSVRRPAGSSPSSTRLGVDGPTSTRKYRRTLRPHPAEQRSNPRTSSVWVHLRLGD